MFTVKQCLNWLLARYYKVSAIHLLALSYLYLHRMPTPRSPQPEHPLYQNLHVLENFFFSQCLRLDPENSNRTANHQGTFACIVDQNSGNQEWVIRGISSVHSSNNGDQCRETPGRAVCGSSNNTGTTV